MAPLAKTLAHVFPRRLIGPAQGGKALVLGGLQAGDDVIVDGLQKAKAGGKARPVPWSPAGSAPAPAASAPASAASR